MFKISLFLYVVFIKRHTDFNSPEFKLVKNFFKYECNKKFSILPYEYLRYSKGMSIVISIINNVNKYEKMNLF